MDKSKVKAWSHRGGRLWGPENTLCVFRKSLKARAGSRTIHGAELDVSVCATGEVVVIHDHRLKRITGDGRLVKDISYCDLQKLSAGKWFGEEFADERVPLLQDVLDLVDGQLYLNVEMKNTPVEYPDITERLADVLKGYPHKDKLIISAFDHSLLRKFSAIMPELCTALLGNVLIDDFAEYVKRLGCKAWHPFFLTMRPDVVDQAHNLGLEVNAWTVNGEEDWNTAIECGVDGLITDDPEGLLQFLEGAAASETAQIRDGGQ